MRAGLLALATNSSVSGDVDSKLQEQEAINRQSVDHQAGREEQGQPTEMEKAEDRPSVPDGMVIPGPPPDWKPVDNRNNKYWDDFFLNHNFRVTPCLISLLLLRDGNLYESPIPLTDTSSLFE